MKYEFKLSFEEYYEYNKIYSRLSIGRTLKIIFNLGLAEFIAGIILIILCLFNVFGNGWTIALSIILAAIGAYMMLYSKIFFYTRLKREVRYKHRTQDYFKNIRTVEVSDEYALAYSDTDDYRANFNEDLKEVIETENLIMIMVHGRRGIIIPKRVTNIDELREHLKQVCDGYGIRYRLFRW